MDVLIEKKTPKNLNHYKFFDKNKRKISNNATAAGPRRDGKKMSCRYRAATVKRNKLKRR
jgi:hypothetical protein